jgi:hypothetical protein
MVRQGQQALVFAIRVFRRVSMDSGALVGTRLSLKLRNATERTTTAMGRLMKAATPVQTRAARTQRGILRIKRI